MKINLGYIKRGYLNFFVFLFFAFIFGVLSFGRSFSILHINLYDSPFFITEFFLLISWPLLLLHYNNLLELPKAIKISSLIFFSLGLLHLYRGILDKNLFAWRDIVLFGYLLFLPLIFLLLSNKKLLKIFLIILLTSNIVNIFIGRLVVFKIFSIFNLEFLTLQTRYFNLGLYYGISLSFLISFSIFLFIIF